ncbi:glycosyltransferase [Rouxiella chamberiensis]|uniref:Glycosyltransferase n=1 Tax=Rouxiella chamberiensis TaxID=1513468 RepID=A0ABY7HSL1_9GAMM|nr:glycosyltransferase [Rouxiella chamberiensis]WAT02403.1 glycosyltransferase [Rouxiella chamberiensis]
MRAAIAGCDAIWHADPRARMLHCDPIINIVPPPGGEALQHEAEQHSLAQYQAWDMLCGRLEPELGGAMRYLDLIGANYYHDNQWEMMTHRKLWWHLGDARRAPLHQMLHKLHQRYGRPILLAETSHVGSGRGAWIQHIAGEIAQALLNGIKITGVCLYPIIDRPDWEDNNRWHQSGLWDVPEYTSENYLRVINPPYAVAIKEAQASLRQFVDQLDKRNSDEDKPMTVQKLIVFSHLRWDFVFQRPQHLLTRLAREYQIIFVEEPVYQPGEAAFHFSYPAANVTVARPHTSIQQPGFHDDQLVQLTPLMEQLCHEDEQPLVWFYTPMALPLLANFNASAVIYDCMDELAAFANAPRQLLQRESALLKRASLVFTGGPSLYAAKKDRHPSVYCFPSSVDVVHFEQALDRTNEHPLQENISHPRLGYYGVIDERMDTALLAQLADAHPEWQIVCVGPVVKIDPASLPVRNNIHYLGQQPYQALPQFLAGWDVCLMPFMLNESTQFISPTKVLEYMAAALPVVSTPIKDVAEPYGDVVFIGKDAGSFIAHCERALALTDAQTARMVQRMKQIVSLTSWDSTAQQMKMLMSGAAEKATPLQEPELSQKKSSAFSLTEVASSWLKRSS